MALTYEPTQLLARSIRGIAEAVANTAQFQTETGKDAATSLDENCFWPEAPQADSATQQFLTAPLCLVTMDPEQSLVKPWDKMATGELFVQLALLEDADTYTDYRERFEDCADRFGTILYQATQAVQSEGWIIDRWGIAHPPVLNDIKKYRFKNAAGAEKRVRIFPTIIEWRG